MNDKESFSTTREEGEERRRSPMEAYVDIMTTGAKIWAGSVELLARNQRDYLNLISEAMKARGVTPINGHEEHAGYDPTVFSAGLRAYDMLSKIYVDTVGDSMKYFGKRNEEMTRALLSGDPNQVADLFEQFLQTLDVVLEHNPKIMEDVKEEMGFHVEREDEYARFMETPRAKIWQVLPLAGEVSVNNSRKPVLLVSPFILEDSIMALLPHEGISFAHQFANEGIPTYIIRYDNPAENPDTARMTGEDFTNDLEMTTRAIREKHGLPVTLATVCQGAYLSLLATCSGKLDEHVDGLIQMMPPNAQTEDTNLGMRMETIPESRRALLPEDPAYPTGAATLAMRTGKGSNPWRDAIQSLTQAERGSMSKSSAAIANWLDSHGRPMPRETVALVLAGALRPISPDGVLPQELFGKPLSLKHIEEAGIKLGIFAGGRDDVISPESAGGIIKYFSPDYKGGTFTVEEKFGHISYLTSATTPAGRMNTPRNPLNLHCEWDNALNLEQQ